MRMYPRPKRYGAHVVTRGKYEGALHVSTKAFRRFRGELLVLDHYLDCWALPQESEETTMARIILILQNILEHEIELVIASKVKGTGENEDIEFANRIEEGYVSFKSKFEWLFNKALITDTEKQIMDEIRKVRNEQVHARPTQKRRKLKYFDKQLMTRKALRQILTDVQPLVEKLRTISGSKERRGIIPPRFFDEEEWNGM